MGKDLKVKELGKRSMEYRYSAKEWRIGEPKSKSGYRTIPLTEEAVTILKKQKKRIRGFTGGNRENEIRNRYYEADFINVHISC